MVSSNPQANLMLKLLSKINQELVTFSYKDYRKLFSITQVPMVKQVRNSKDKEEILFVKVDRLKAIAFLTRANDFCDKNTLKEKLNELSSELCGNIQGE